MGEREGGKEGGGREGGREGGMKGSVANVGRVRESDIYHRE